MIRKEGMYKGESEVVYDRVKIDYIRFWKLGIYNNVNGGGNVIVETLVIFI